QGSEFRAYFPILGPVAKERSPSSSMHRRPSLEDARILVVDDDDIIRSMLAKALSKLGYIVESCSSGEKAIAKFTDSPNRPFDVLILDMNMPGRGGEDVYMELRELHPTLPVILMSGQGPKDPSFFDKCDDRVQ